MNVSRIIKKKKKKNVFFYKQKTEYEMLRSLVGSEMCIRDRIWRGGCIIRSAFLNKIYEAFRREPGLPNLIMDNYFTGILRENSDSSVSYTHLTLPTIYSV